MASGLDLSTYSGKLNVENFTRDVEIIKKIFAYKQLGPENVSRVVTETVVRVRRLAKFSMNEKIGLAIHVINHLIEELVPGRDAPMEVILKLMVPDLVEQLMMLDFGKFCVCFKA